MSVRYISNATTLAEWQAEVVKWLRDQEDNCKRRMACAKPQQKAKDNAERYAYERSADFFGAIEFEPKRD